MNDEDDTHQDRERPRPKVVDRRVTSRAAGEGSTSTAEPSRAATAEEGGDAPTPEAQAPPREADASLWTPEQEAEARRVAERIAEAPSREWVVGIAADLANIAVMKLERGMIEDAHLVIDALAALVQGVGSRLGDAEPALRQTLAQLQLAYAQRASPAQPQ